MYRYADHDERNHDTAGRVSYLKVLADDCDAIARVLERNARAADPPLAGSLHRLATVARDFVTNATNAFASATPAVKAWIEQN
jgi:hypothetical protein